MEELLFFKVKDGYCLNIPREVGINYYDFGAILLQERTGAHIHALEHELYRNCEEINKRILEEWLEMSDDELDRKPVTWNILVEVIDKIGKGELAAKMRETAPKQLETDKEV